MSVKEAILWRKTVKIFDKNQSISDKEINLIIEAGRLSPSSMGLEIISLIVIKNTKIKNQFAKFIMNKSNNIKTVQANILIFILGYNDKYILNDNFLLLRLNRNFGFNKVLLNEMIKKYKKYLLTKKNINSFINNHAYITLSFMILQAADLKIGSTIIGGFNQKKTNILLEKYGYINKNEKYVIIALLLGKYNENIQNSTQSRVRISTQEFAKIIK